MIAIACLISCKPMDTSKPATGVSSTTTTAPSKEPMLKNKAGRLTKLGKASMAENGKPQIVDVLTDFGSKRRSITDFDGKPKVLGFWASWCGPCVYEKPIFRSMANKYPNINFLSISIDKDIGDAQQFYHDRRIEVNDNDFWIGDSDRNKLKWYTMKPIEGGNGQAVTIRLPAYVLISADGTIINNDLPHPSTGQMEQYLNRLQ